MIDCEKHTVLCPALQVAHSCPFSESVIHKLGDGPGGGRGKKAHNSDEGQAKAESKNSQGQYEVIQFGNIAG